MDCCNNKGQKRSWLLPLVAVVLVGAMIAFRQFSIFTAWPLAMLILCPLIHGAMFFFMARGKKDSPQPPSA